MSKESTTHRYFNTIAYNYDNYEIPETHRCYPLLMEELPSQFSSILDVGCGTGVMLQQISERYENVELFGMDLSEEMIRQAQGKNIRNSQFMVGNASSLPYEESSFDVVICMHSFHHYKKPLESAKEMIRVLKPGGCLIVIENYRKGIRRYIKNIQIKIYFGPRYGDIKVYSMNEMVSIFNQVGASSINCKRITSKSFACRVIK